MEKVAVLGFILLALLDVAMPQDAFAVRLSG